MRQKTMRVVGFLVLITLGLTCALGQSGYDDFQKALRAERGEGNLQKAIALYEKVIREAADQSLSAEAQLRIGMCYEKMGLEETQEAYEKVIADYPGQTEAVAIAQGRLIVLTETKARISAAPNFREIKIPGNLEFLAEPQLSPDGKQLAFTFQEALWLMPLHGKVHADVPGAPVRLTDPLGARSFAISWSADGQWIAFHGPDEFVYRVRIDGSSISKLSRAGDPGAEVNDYRISLSPDGSQLAYSSFQNRKSFIFTAPIGGGPANRLTNHWSREPAFSPDGTKIAYVRLFEPWNAVAPGEIWVVSASGGEPVRVSEMPGIVRGPIWSPDGSRIAFYRGSNGEQARNEIWIVSITSSGNPTGPGKKIELPSRTRHFLAGWTSDNAIGIPFLTPYREAIYTISAEGGKATQISPNGLVRHPRWTPDGERVFLRWGRGAIAFVPSDGGDITIVEPPADSRLVEVTSGGGNVVSPDGGTIAFSAYQRGDRPIRQHIWTMPVDGGKPTELTHGPDADRFPRWSPDGSNVAFIRAEETGDSAQINIWTAPAVGGESAPLTGPADRVDWSPISWSPDGSLIAYFSNVSSIRVKPVNGGRSRDVVAVDEHTQENELAWSPDSQEIVYTSDGRIWRVRLEDGLPREVETGSVGSVTNIDWSPNGEALTFRAATGGETVLVLMEDFLPLPNSDGR
jgi:Tol biopolymer transport system component